MGSGAEFVRNGASLVGRLWLYCLKRAVWVVLLSAMASVLRVSLSQDMDAASSGDMMEPLEAEMGNSTDIFPPCPVNTSCEELPGHCLDCNFNETNCTYGNITEVTCMPRETVECNVRWTSLSLAVATCPVICYCSRGL